MLDINTKFSNLFCMNRYAMVFLIAGLFSVQYTEGVYGDEEWKKEYFQAYKYDYYRSKSPLFRFGVSAGGAMESGYNEVEKFSTMNMSALTDFYFYRSNHYGGFQSSWYVRIPYIYYGFGVNKDKDENYKLEVWGLDPGLRLGYGFFAGPFYLEPYMLLSAGYSWSKLVTQTSSGNMNRFGGAVGLGMEFLFANHTGVFVEAYGRTPKLANEDIAKHVSAYSAIYMGMVFKSGYFK